MSDDVIMSDSYDCRHELVDVDIEEVIRSFRVYLCQFDEAATESVNLTEIKQADGDSGSSLAALFNIQVLIGINNVLLSFLQTVVILLNL